MTLGVSSLINRSLPLVPLGVVGLVFYLQWKDVSWSIVMVLLVAGIVALFMTAATPAETLKMYFTFLVFEGALKIWSNYNPVMRVGSDLLLLLVLSRLISRENRSEVVTRDQAGRVLQFMVLFWLWVAVQFVNPWGLGVLPSLAALKVYALPLLMFIIVAFLTEHKETKFIPVVILGLALFEGGVAMADWLMGDTFLPNLNGRYRTLVGDRFVGVFYRPFGTTNLPGGPSSWMFHGAMAALLVQRLVDDAKQQGERSHWLWQGMILVFVPLCFATLFACQGRTLMLRTAALVVLGFGLSSTKRATITLVAVMGLASLLMPVLKAAERIEDPFYVPTSQVEQAVTRFATLQSKETWATARQGAWPAMVQLAGKTMSGIGLSRVGAAADPWVDRIRDDPHFGLDWSFADNLWRALFTELGLGGLAAFLVLTLGTILQLLNLRHYVGYITALYSSLILVSGFGSEAILYNPDAAMFWFNAAYAMRYRPLGAAGGAI